jgi:hypothetical protein
MDNFYTASKPFLTLLRFLGLFPLSFVGPTSHGVLKSNLLDVMIALLWFSSLFCNAFLIISMNFNVYEGNSKVLPKAWSVVTVVELSLSIFLFSYQLKQRENIVRFLSVIHKCDEKVSCGVFESDNHQTSCTFQAKALNIKTNFKAQKRLGIAFITVGCTVGLLSFAIRSLFFHFSQRISPIDIRTTISYSYMNFFRNFYMMQFMFAVSSVKTRFQDLNETLVSLESSPKFISKESDIEGMFSIAELHHNLCDAIDLINQTFTFPLIGIFLNSLVRFLQRRHSICFIFFFLN